MRNEYYKGRDGPFVFNTLLSLFIYALTEVKGAIFIKAYEMRYLRVMLFGFGWQWDAQQSISRLHQYLARL